MGTSGSYSGSGGKIGDGVREAVRDWIDSLPPDRGPDGPSDPSADGGPEPAPTKLDPKDLLPILGLLRPRSSGGGGADGPGGGGTGGAAAGGGGRRSGGPTRTVGRSASTAGRAAAAAYAYRAGDAPALQRLGLDYAELTALGDQFEITRRIVDAACGPSDSTIEDHEQRLVAADIAEWVMSENGGGQPPSPEEIVRHTIGLIIADALLSETGALINGSGQAELAESEIRDAAEALASREALAADGVTDAEFTAAIERGIETLRGILKDGT